MITMLSGRLTANDTPRGWKFRKKHNSSRNCLGHASWRGARVRRLRDFFFRKEK
jgi:hypothetical protein